MSAPTDKVRVGSVYRSAGSARFGTLWLVQAIHGTDVLWQRQYAASPAPCPGNLHGVTHINLFTRNISEELQ